jgi:TonB family protein
MGSTQVMTTRLALVLFLSLSGLALAGCDRLVEAQTSSFQGVIGTHNKEVKTCYERHRQDAPGLEGKIDLAWTVQPDGAVTDVAVAENSTGSEDLAKCLVRRVMFWEFQGTEEPQQVTHAFTFN